jgi:hypothetical protein
VSLSTECVYIYNYVRYILNLLYQSHFIIFHHMFSLIFDNMGPPVQHGDGILRQGPGPGAVDIGVYIASPMER